MSVQVKSAKQLPGCLPPGATVDSLLTVEECAIWQRRAESSLRKSLPSMPGVVQESRECIRINPRLYLEKRTKRGSR